MPHFATNFCQQKLEQDIKQIIVLLLLFICDLCDLNHLHLHIAEHKYLVIDKHLLDRGHGDKHFSNEGPSISRPKEVLRKICLVYEMLFIFKELMPNPGPV